MYLVGNYHNHTGSFPTPLLIYLLHHSLQLAVTMKAELQDVMDMLRKLQGAIDFGNAPMAERDELARDVSDIMDALFEVMKNLPDVQTQHK